MTNPTNLNTGPQDQEVLGFEGAPQDQPMKRVFIRLTSIPAHATLKEIEDIIKEAREATQAEQKK